jgi:L-threonylcarbamoyladenylate synthase
MFKKEIENTIATLKKGGLILYPTDTVWGLGCDATNFEAVKKIYTLKKRADSKSMICLVADLEMLEQYVEEVPRNAGDILIYSTKPTTIIYDNPLRVAENLVANDNSLGIRVVNDNFCETLLKRFKKPIVSTSANISGNKTPSHFKEISEDILKGVDYIVNLNQLKKCTKPSAIIKLKNDGRIKIIRR